MPNFLSRIIHFGAHLRRQPVAYATRQEQTQTFPVNSHGMQSLKNQIESSSKLRLGRDNFLALVKSTVFETRKHALQLNSIADINTILEETDTISNLVFAQIGEHIPRFRHGLRLEYFRAVIGMGNQFKAERFRLLQNHSGFPGHKQLQQEIIRCQIEANLELDYGLPPRRNTQRVTRQTSPAISKPEYAQHCLNLLNLGMPIDAETTEKMVELCQDTHLPKPWIRYFKNAHQSMVPVHVVIADLLRANLNLKGNHNTHPASRLMEFSTGFVFHPNSTTNINQLLNPNSPSAFQNFGKLLADRYVAAFECNNTQHFFENAFVQQDPCFEATVENLIEFKPQMQANTLTVPPTPKWTPLASTEENIEALLDWQELATLKIYIDSNHMVVMADDHKKIEQLLDSTEFNTLIRSKKTELFSLLIPLIPKGIPHQLQAQLDARWP